MENKDEMFMAKKVFNPDFFHIGSAYQIITPTYVFNAILYNLDLLHLYFVTADRNGDVKYESYSLEEFDQYGPKSSLIIIKKLDVITKDE